MTLPPDVLAIGDRFHNLRSAFRIGLLDIRTQSSLVQLTGGGFVLLDACEFSDEMRKWLHAHTGGDVRAILHLHPFHTAFVQAAHDLFPRAKLYGTARHHAQAPELTWQPEATDSPALPPLFADDLEFSVPRGVTFIPENEKLHFASVLAFHPASRTLHVDDTILYMKLPKLLRVFKRDVLRFHPTLSKVLEPRAGAADEFRAWAEELVERCREVDHLCAAHSTVLRTSEPPLAQRVRAALDNVESTLRSHRASHG